MKRERSFKGGYTKTPKPGLNHLLKSPKTNKVEQGRPSNEKSMLPRVALTSTGAQVKIKICMLLLRATCGSLTIGDF